MKQKHVFFWLLTCITLIFSMIILGGYTRLSHSGLSIVEWAPISGTIPPLNDDDWNIEFSKYKSSPEYQKVNYGMNLNEFKEIFLVEYLHRLLGRIIGLSFVVPLLYFITTKKINRSEIKDYGIIATLIGIQGLIGWLMVKSGLVNQPNVSQYRLAMHLIMACIILILLVWKITPGEANKNKYGYISLGLLLLQILSGAFVAGLHAGLTYNTFPLMDGDIIPRGLLMISPWYKNIFENIITVQFTHRALGVINFFNLLAYAYVKFYYYNNKKIALLISLAVLLQFILGILTLLLQVPLLLALSHQAVAILLLIITTISLKKSANP